MRFLRVMLGFVLGLVVVCTQATDAAPVDDWNQQAEQFLSQGNPLAAYQASVKAQAQYEQSQDQVGITQSLINQARAYQALGQPLNACYRLTQALKLEDSLCQTRHSPDPPNLPQRVPQNPMGVQVLSTVLQQLGQLDTARALLTQALSQSYSPLFELSLANIDRALFLHNRNRYQGKSPLEIRVPALLSASTSAKLGLERYKSLIEGTYPDKIKRSALLNWLLLYTDLTQWVRSEQAGRIPELVSIQSSAAAQLASYRQALLAADFSAFAPIDRVYTQLKIANSLLTLGMDEAVSGQLILSALNQATQLDNPRALSLAQGTLALLYLQQNRRTEAIQAFEQARSLALSLRAADLAYKWDWQLARLYRNSNSVRAIARYEEALEGQESVRANLFPANQEVQFAFAESLDPLYREYLSLLLTQPHPDLEKVLDVHERSQVAALETFLQCGRLDLVSLKDVQKSTTATFLHILDVGDRIIEIIRTPEGSLTLFSPNSKQVRESADYLINSLQDPRFFTFQSQSYLPDAQVLYQELITPALQANVLPRQGTLVFITDDFLQNLPLGLLHDGHEFLLEQYQISTLFAGSVRRPKPLQPQLKTLVGGISQKSPSLKNFPHLSELPEVETEVQVIHHYTQLERKLLNQNFTWAGFQTSLNHSEAAIIHVSTHGQFSSDPQQTMLLAWDKPISVSDMALLFQHRLSSHQLSPPALLFLSACQTAQGDPRAVFGMAGLAIQSGSASVIASLWQIDSEATVALVEDFYAALNTGLGRAAALQKAQLSLLHNPKYAHPYYWSTFTLLGDWL